MKVIEQDDGTVEHVFYVQNKRVATHTFFADGDLNEAKGNIPDGEVSVKDKDNKIVKKINYKNNKKNGLYREYYTDGELKLKANYKDDKIQGLVYEYFDTGEVNLKWNYKDNEKEGTSYELDEEGKVTRVLMFEKGKELEVKSFYEKVVR